MDSTKGTGAPPDSVPFSWSSSWSGGEWIAPFEEVDGTTPEDSTLGVYLERCGTGALQGIYWFDSPERLAEALCFALPNIFGWLDGDEDGGDDDGADDDAAGSDGEAPTSLQDIPEGDARRAPFVELVGALRESSAAARARALASAIGTVDDLLGGTAQSSILWLGTFGELRAGGGRRGRRRPRRLSRSPGCRR